MIILADTNDKLQVVTGTAVSTQHVHCSWIDLDGTTVTPGATDTLITLGAPTTTDVVAAPSGTAKRNVKMINIRNQNANTANAITVQHYDGTNTIELYKTTLQPQETLQYTDAEGWLVIDASGGRKVAGRTGLFLRTTVLTSGTGATYTTGKDCNSIFVRMVGGGGGGGGCTSVASAGGAAGGGGAGGYAEKLFAVAPNTGYTYTVGAAGNGVSGAGGANGTSSTFAVGGTTVTALLGTGAAVMAPAATLKTGAGGAGGTVSTNGDVNSAGAPGAYGVCLLVAGPIVASGEGGSGPFGAGGLGIIAAGNGNACVGYGAGGGGSATGASTVRTGGNGTGGVIIIDEYA